MYIYKTPGVCQLPAEFIQAGSKTLGYYFCLE